MLISGNGHDRLTGGTGALPSGVSGVDGAGGYELHYGAGDVVTLVGVSAAQAYDWARIHVDGTDANETLTGGSNADMIDGNDGRDRLSGGDGADVIDGGKDHDVFYGDDVLRDSVDGNDTLFGDAGAEVLDGGIGHDTLYGRSGDDRLTGGTGRDIFVFQTGDGIDTITDLDAADDRFRLSGTGQCSLESGRVCLRRERRYQSETEVFLNSM